MRWVDARPIEQAMKEIIWSTVLLEYHYDMAKGIGVWDLSVDNCSP
jgi:hypothetical protein